MSEFRLSKLVVLIVCLITCLQFCVLALLSLFKIFASDLLLIFVSSAAFLALYSLILLPFVYREL